MQRSTQANILLYAYDSVTGSPATGLSSATVTTYISKDGTTPTQTTNSPTEIDATHQPGWYCLTLTATETDCASALITATHATAHLAVTSLEFDASDIAGALATYGAAKTSDIPTVQDIQNGLATSSALEALETHGDTAWATITGYAKPGDAMSLTAEYDAAKTQVDVGASLTAYGAAKTSDIPSVAAVQAGLATDAGLAAMQTHGDTTWAKTPAADIAESVLVADVSTAAVTATPDSLAGVILAMFHSTIGTDGTWTIYKGDDTTPFAVKTVLPSANATPIVGVANSEG